jgi:two-component system, chemotaxis family, response regulator Rcp1
MMNATHTKTRNVLLVDDSPGDVLLMRLAFREIAEHVALHVATDGLEAMAFLKREGEHIASPRPDLILLDLNMPRMSGREALALMKSDANLRTIPVVILTTSAAEEDITACYELLANSYLSKPVDLEEFDSLVRSVSNFWFSKAKLPPPLSVDHHG